MLGELVARISHFSEEEQVAIVKRLNDLLIDAYVGKTTDRALISARSQEFVKSKPVCIHCGSDHLIGFGYTIRKARRYRCKTCLKTFSETTGTVIDGIVDLEKFNHYLSCMLKGYSLRKCSQEVGINLTTSFNWRHRILKALENIAQSQMEHIVEVDETFFLFSEKGNKQIHGRQARKRGSKATQDGMNKQHANVIVATDRKGHKLLRYACRGKVTKAAVHKSIGSMINKSNTVVSDAERNIAFYLKDRSIEHVRLKAREKQRVWKQVYHIQNANNLQSQLKTWMKDFRGVATKYLQNYLNWFLLLQQAKDQINQTRFLCQKVMVT